MNLDRARGILRASLFLAEGFLSRRKDQLSNEEVLDECENLIADYLTTNGLKFDYSHYPSSSVTRYIMKIARRMVANNLSPMEAIEKLSKRLKIDLTKFNSID